MAYSPHLLLLLFLLIFGPKVFSQNHETRIRSIREASNRALQAYDHAKVLSYLTDDVLTTTGNGTLLAGKEALKTYIAEGGDSKMYWIRSPEAIEVNEQKGLAWETGHWEGFDPDAGTHPVVGGNYSAMWTLASGEWKIKSQLFVSLNGE